MEAMKPLAMKHFRNDSFSCKDFLRWMTILCFLVLPYGQVPIKSFSFDPAPYEEYFELTAKYFGDNGGRATECLEYARTNGWKFSSKSLFNVGLEGSGHHMMLEMDGSVPPQGHGGAISFSSCGTCPGNAHAWRLNATKRAFNPYLNNNKTGKFLVLVRDPVDTFHSALRRFWHPDLWPTDTLEKERLEVNKSMDKMNRRLAGVSCEKTVFVSYELLTHFPDIHVRLFATFLQIRPDHQGLQRWFDKLRQRRIEYMQRHGNASLLVQKDRIGPFIIPCDSGLKARISKYDWPDDWAKNCSSHKECERAFHNVTQNWVHPELKRLYPSIVPQHPMSQCEEA